MLNDRRIRIRIQEAQKHVDPVDPDPQHWFREVFLKERKQLNWPDKEELCHFPWGDGGVDGGEQVLSNEEPDQGCQAPDDASPHHLNIK